MSIGPAWSRDTGATGAPIAAGRLVVTAGEGGVSAVSAADGSPLWTADLADVKGEPAVGPDGSVYAVSGDHRLVALDGSTGSERWHADFEGYLSCSPGVAEDGSVAFLLKERGDRVVWLDGSTGRRLGSRELRMSIVHRRPVVLPDGSALVFNANDHTLHRLHHDPSHPGWRFPVGDLLAGDPSAGPDGTVYVPRAFGDVLALGAEDGKLLWKQRLGASPAVAAGEEAVFVRSSEGRVTALQPASGSVLWERDVAEAPLSEPRVDARGDVVLGGGDGVARALDGHSGRPRWTAAVGGSLGRPEPGPQDEIFFADGAGRLVGLHPSRDMEVAPSVAGAIQVGSESVTIGDVELAFRAEPRP